MPIEQISNDGYSMYLDNGSLFESRDLAQKRQLEQNALRRQTGVRNALAANIDPMTGLTNYPKAYAMGGQDVAPELQQMQQADLMARADYNKKLADIANTNATAGKTTSDQQIAEINEFATYLAPVNDQQGYTAWRTPYVQKYPFLDAMIPATYSPEIKNSILQKTKAKAENLRFADEGGMQNVGRDPRTGALVTPGVAQVISPDEQSRINREFNPDKVAHLPQTKMGTFAFLTLKAEKLSPALGKALASLLGLSLRRA